MTLPSITLGFLFDDVELANEFLRALNSADKHEAAADLIKEYPMRVLIDNEVIHSVDKTSYDEFELVIRIPHVQTEGDTLEDLADVETTVDAAREIIRDNQFSCQLTNLL